MRFRVEGIRVYIWVLGFRVSRLGLGTMGCRVYGL